MTRAFIVSVGALAIFACAPASTSPAEPAAPSTAVEGESSASAVEPESAPLAAAPISEPEPEPEAEPEPEPEPELELDPWIAQLLELNATLTQADTKGKQAREPIEPAIEACKAGEILACSVVATWVWIATRGSPIDPSGVDAAAVVENLDTLGYVGASTRAQAATRMCAQADACAVVCPKAIPALPDVPDYGFAQVSGKCKALRQYLDLTGLGIKAGALQWGWATYGAFALVVIDAAQ